jgi:hypothetical protein
VETSEDYLKRVVFHFLTLNRSSIKESEGFVSLKHNEDLCPGLNYKIELILSYFQRYRKISYDMQGIKDEGSDVLLRYYLNEKSHFICFQIKSLNDLKDKYYLQKIKAQYVDSQNKFDFEDYYIILATDEKKAINKIRMIKGSFSSIDNVTIIDPSQFLFFWKLKDSQIGAIVKSFVSSGDLLLQNALNTVKGLLRPKYILVFFILDFSVRKGFSNAIDIDDVTGSTYLYDVYKSFVIENEEEDEYEDSYPFDSDSYDSDNPEKMIERDLNNMSELYFNIDFEKRIIIPDYDYLKAIVALILEAQLKYEFDAEDTIEYLEQLIFGLI